MQISTLNALQDNYIYLAAAGGDAVVVDIGEAAPVLTALEKDSLRLRTVLITHRHADHIGGLAELRAAHPAAEVYAPAGCGIADATICEHGDTVRLLDGALSLRVTATPGHTLEHIAYAGGGVLFSGDTLFIGGCGRVFEGTMRQMHDSLAALAALPDETMVYCGHEYTCANLRFALAVQPDNAALAEHLQAIEMRLANGQASVPGRLGDEKKFNPFLRLTDPAIIAAAERHSGESCADSVAVFTALRRWKDSF